MKKQNIDYKEYLNKKPYININNANTELEILYPIKLVSASRPRISKFGVYYPSSYKNFMQVFSLYNSTYLNTYKDFFNEQDINLQIELITYSQLPKNVLSNKKQRALLKNTLSNKYPDIDNYLKNILDGLQKFFSFNDSKVSIVIGKKYLIETESCFYIKLNKNIKPIQSDLEKLSLLEIPN